MTLTVARSPLHGRGCFASRAVAAGEAIIAAPVLIFPPDAMAGLFATPLKHYLFYLKDGPYPDGPFWTALALGPVSLCNHAEPPACHFAIDEADETIRLIARRDIAEGEELTISYGDWADEIVPPA